MSDVNIAPLVRAIESVDREVTDLGIRIATVDANIGRISQDMDSTRSELLALRKEFGEFVLAAQRTANVQRSETVLGNVEAALERDYGHYKVVRRASIGTLQAFDIGNVSNKTVQQVSEELMIQTPRYWLAPALVALAAWSRDNKDLADRSVEAAFTRDPRKTSLFFALVLRRQGRMEGATRWLRHYLGSLDPRGLGREFAVILEGAAQEAFGVHGKALIGTQLATWTEQLRNDPAVAAAQVGSWTKELTILRGTVDDEVYPHVSRVSPQWAQFRDVLEHASALGFAERKFTEIKDTPTPLVLSVQDRLDDVLELLVTEFDEEELPFQRDAVYHRSVIESSGDLDRAQEAADAINVALEETSDVVSLQTQTAIRPEMFGVSVSAQKVAIGGSRRDFAAAVGKYAAAYRQRYLDTLDLELGPDHSNFAQAFGFVGWQSDTATQQATAEQSLADAWHRSFEAHIDRVSFKNIEYLKVGGLALAIALLGLVVLGAAGIVVLLLAAGAAGFWLWRKKSDADKQVAEAHAAREQALQFSVDVYRAAVAEFVDARLAYQAEDAHEADLLTLIDTWPTVVDDTIEEFAS